MGKQARYSEGYYCRACECGFDAHVQKNGRCGCCKFMMRAAAHRQPENKPRAAVPSELRPKMELVQ